MNKNEVVDAVNEKSGLSKKDCRLCMETMLEVIKIALQKGESVNFSNFGKFKVNNIKSKHMYNFKTKEIQLGEARKIPSFKASENLKQCIK